jgi:arylsulfatase A-like enzyme
MIVSCRSRRSRLAASGLRFTNGYSASSVCSPTRFGLYTGRYPGRLHGGLAEPLGAVYDVDGIPSDHPTLASLLKDVGYETAMFGKWHCGFLPSFSPTRVGWDEFFGNFGGAIDYFSKIGTDGVRDLYEGEVQVEDLRYYTHILADRAIEYISRPRQSPWLLNLNFTTPHWPWEGPHDRAVSDDLTRRVLDGDALLAHYDGGSLDVYQAMVEDLDRSVGRVLAAIDHSGQAHDTVVFFASDNGGERFSYVWPFTGGKFTLNEGGIRVPTILSWPGTLPQGRVSHEPVVTMDWTATFVELAGAQPAEHYPFDGTSLVPYLLRGRRLAERSLFWRMHDWRALRKGSLKYLQTDDGTDHLFDLGADEHEQADLVDLRPEDLDRLRASWEQINADQLPYD